MDNKGSTFYDENKFLVDKLKKFVINGIIENAEKSWLFASQEYKKNGPGCMIVYLRSLEESLDLSGMPLTYIYGSVLEEIGYQPCIDMVSTYEHENEFVVLILLNIDQDDSLCISYIINKNIKSSKNNGTKAEIIEDSSISHSMIDNLYKPYGCLYCKKLSDKMYHCGNCKIAQYCNKDCQKNDWISHKEKCQIILISRNKNS
jgi:hypothetical protein